MLPHLILKLEIILSVVEDVVEVVNVLIVLTIVVLGIIKGLSILFMVVLPRPMW